MGKWLLVEEIHNVHITLTMAESVEVNKASNLRVINFLWFNKIIKGHADLNIDPFCKKISRQFSSKKNGGLSRTDVSFLKRKIFLKVKRTGLGNSHTFSSSKKLYNILFYFWNSLPFINRHKYDKCTDVIDYTFFGYDRLAAGCWTNVALTNIRRAYLPFPLKHDCG